MLRRGSSPQGTSGGNESSPLPSVVQVFAKGATKEDSGTGFLVRPNLIATCRHVVYPDREKPRELHVSWPPTNSERLKCEIFLEDDGTDLAVLKTDLDTPDDLILSVARLAGKEPGVGEKIAIWGFSSDYYKRPQRFEGSISGKAYELGLIGMGCTVHPGDSGGPVQNERGEVVGISCLKDREREGQAMLIPVSLLVRLLPPPPPHPPEVLWRLLAGLIIVLLVYVLGHMIWGGGKQRNPPDPEDYFKVNSDNGAGAPWRSSEHAYHVEGKWVQPKDMNDPLVMMDEGLAMPNTSDPLFRDAATKEVATFKRFHGEYDFSKFIEGTKVMWLVWVWPQATSEGRGIEAGALRYYKFTLEWRQTSHPVIVKAEYCSRPGLPAWLAWFSSLTCVDAPDLMPTQPAAGNGCVFERVQSVEFHAKEDSLQMIINLAGNCAYQADHRVQRVGGPGSLYGAIAIKGDSKTDAILEYSEIGPYR